MRPCVIHSMIGRNQSSRGLHNLWVNPGVKNLVNKALCILNTSRKKISWTARKGRNFPISSEIIAIYTTFRKKEVLFREPVAKNAPFSLICVESIVCLYNPSQKKIWSVSTRLSEHLFAVKQLNKFETANISIYKQNKSDT